MKKYLVLSYIGWVIHILGIIGVVIVCCTDLDKSPNLTCYDLVILILLAAVTVAIGYALIHFSNVEGFMIGVTVVIGAKLFNISKHPSSLLIRCKLLRDDHPCDTVRACIRIYNNYLIQSSRSHHKEETHE